MKISFLAITILSLFLGACASDHPGQRSQSATVYSRDSEPSQRRPHLGMTRDEVQGLYGKPTAKLFGPKGEAWKYWFNRSATVWIGARPRIAVIIFDNNGRVKDFVWNEE